ncbi:MAG: hypothetical protein A2103_01955 [Gammaproteobacteria bacterium GWF2_41_13]|nr:MAG: hypothetical protein A2103_01955 [Gammaproteobacteria bacterium GWF2_41_13]
MKRKLDELEKKEQARAQKKSQREQQEKLEQEQKTEIAKQQLSRSWLETTPPNREVVFNPAGQSPLALFALLEAAASEAITTLPLSPSSIRPKIK